MVLRPIQEVDGSVSLPRLPRPAQESRPGDAGPRRGRWKAVLRPIQEVDGSVSLPRLLRPAQESRPGDAGSRRGTPPFPGDGRHKGHTRDIHPFVLEMDSGILRHATARGFVKTPAATALFRRWPGGLEAAREE